MIHHDTPQQHITPDQIIADCVQLIPTDNEYLQHGIIQRFGSPLQPIYVDPCNVDINGVTYEQPMILPIYNGRFELIQCAVLQHGKRVEFTEGGIAKGFTYYGELKKDKPVMITH